MTQMEAASSSTDNNSTVRSYEEVIDSNNRVDDVRDSKLFPVREHSNQHQRRSKTAIVLPSLKSVLRDVQQRQLAGSGRSVSSYNHYREHQNFNADQSRIPNNSNLASLMTLSDTITNAARSGGGNTDSNNYPAARPALVNRMSSLASTDRSSSAEDQQSQTSTWLHKYLAHSRNNNQSEAPIKFYDKLSKVVQQKKKTMGKVESRFRKASPPTPSTNATALNSFSNKYPLTSQQLVTRYNRSGSVKRCWLREEDETLSMLAHEYGYKDWAEIAKHFPGRNTKQCRDRWHNQLNPDIKRSPWMTPEDSLLMEAHKELGNKWSLIAEMLPGRTATNVKNRYRTIVGNEQRRSAQKDITCPRPALAEVGLARATSAASNHHTTNIYESSLQIQMQQTTRYYSPEFPSSNSTVTYEIRSDYTTRRLPSLRSILNDDATVSINAAPYTPTSTAYHPRNPTSSSFSHVPLARHVAYTENASTPLDMLTESALRSQNPNHPQSLSCTIPTTTIPKVNNTYEETTAASSDLSPPWFKKFLAQRRGENTSNNFFNALSCAVKRKKSRTVSKPSSSQNFHETRTSTTFFAAAAVPQSYNKSGSVKRKWTETEDKMLTQLAKEYGYKSWVEVAAHLPGRKAKQCRDRWHNQLHPDIKRTPWEPEEDSLLVEARGELGSKWSLIAEMLPGRTPTNVKNRFRTINGNKL